MEEELDIRRHNENMISIMDMVSDLNISNHKWDFIFDYILERTNFVYFEGFRKWVDDEKLPGLIDAVSEKILFIEKRKILIKVKISTLIYNRSLHHDLWEYYEYPDLIFAVQEEHETELTKLTAQLPGREKSPQSLSGVYVLSRGGAPDVLWLYKSPDMEYPWQTKPSPLMIEQEQNRSWFGKLLDFLRMDIKVKGKKI